MYNFMLAFVACAAAYIIGEVVSTMTKAWVPSVFVTAVVMLIGYWTVFPETLVTDSVLIPFGSTLGIYLCLTHMGTVISIKQLVEQWKTIVVCLAGLAGMCALCLVICPLVMDKAYVISGLPPLTGGIIAAVTMQEAAAEKGLADAALFAIAMYCVQGFAAYPLTAVCLQLEGKKMLQAYRSGDLKVIAASNKVDAVNGKLETEAAPKKKLIPPARQVEFQRGDLPAPGHRGLPGHPVRQHCHPRPEHEDQRRGLGPGPVRYRHHHRLPGGGLLNKAHSYGIVMFALMMYVFDGLKTSTPEMLAGVILPMIILIIVGVFGMGVLCFVISKILRMPFLLSYATALTALYGFPPNAIITESTCAALAQTPEEKDYLMSQMFAPMIVGGFTTVTITSVIIAGIFAGML